MSQRIPLPVLLACAALVIGALTLASFVEVRAAERDEKFDGENIEKYMDAIDGAMRKLKAKVAEPKLDIEAGLPLILTVQENVVLSKKGIPPKSKKLEGEAKAQFMLGYSKMLNEVLRGAIDLEEAFLDGNTQAAGEAYGKLLVLKKKGHDGFK